MEDRIKTVEATLKDMKPKVESIDVIANDISWIKGHLKKNGFVRKEEFKPIKNVVYGMVGLILTSVFVAILAIVLP